MKTDSHSVLMHSWGQREIKISKSNLERGDISFLPLDGFINSSAIGGANAADRAPQNLTVIFDGQAFETDIDGSQWTLRDRASLVDFLFLFGAKVGDDLVINRVADYVYSFRVRSVVTPSNSEPNGATSAGATC